LRGPPSLWASVEKKEGNKKKFLYTETPKAKRATFFRKRDSNNKGSWEEIEKKMP